MFLDFIHSRFFGPAVLVGLFLVGGYFSIRLRVFWLRHPIKTCHRIFQGEKPKSVFRAVCLALAGTMGVGNITGVALALLSGGPGAIFWMLLSAFFAMAVKYAEVLLALDSRRKNKGEWQGGAPFYMSGRIFPALFSILCVACAFFQGGVIQGNAAALSLSQITPFSPLLCGVFFATLALFIFLFFRHKISSITALLIPLATGLYFVMCLVVIVSHAPALPSVIESIFTSAFTPRAGASGVTAYLFTEGARIGCARGLLSNEAGCGTAPLAHITAEGTTPPRQGVWGIFEVFLDTVVVCTLTALACLVVMPHTTNIQDFTTEVFASVFGGVAPYFVGICLIFFAYSTILTWAFYGLSSLHLLFPSTPVFNGIYFFIYSFSVAIGAICSTRLAFSMTDVLLAIMTLMNLLAITKKADRVVTLSAKEGFIYKCCKRECGPVPVPQEHPND